jgi:hypothetical protein
MMTQEHIMLSRRESALQWVLLGQYGELSGVAATFRAIGGDWLFEATVKSDERGLVEAAPSWLGQWLWHAASQWTGMVVEVGVTDGILKYTWSLSNHANRVAVVRQRGISNWAIDPLAGQQYGAWELVVEEREATDVQADAQAQRLLAARSGVQAISPAVDLRESERGYAVTVTAMGRLPSAARFATNWRAGTDAIGFDALGVVSTTLSAAMAGKATVLSVASSAAFTAGQPVVVGLDDGRFHYDKVAATGSGTLTITDGLPGSSGDTVASSGRRVSLGEIGIREWMIGTLGATDLEVGVIAGAGTAQIREMERARNCWALLERLSTLVPEHELLYRDNQVHFSAAPGINRRGYIVNHRGEIMHWGGGMIDPWHVRPGWYLLMSQNRQVYVDSVTVRGDGPPALRTQRMVQ